MYNGGLDVLFLSSAACDRSSPTTIGGIMSVYAFSLELGRQRVWRRKTKLRLSLALVEGSKAIVGGAVLALAAWGIIALTFCL